MGDRIVVIGAVAAGTKAAARARRVNPGASITVLTEEADVSYAGCGLPYYVGGVIPERAQLVVRKPESFREKERVEVLTRVRVTGIARDRKQITATNLEGGSSFVLDYDRLIIATGARAVVPDIPGVHLNGVHTLRSISDADGLKGMVDESARRGGGMRAVIAGGGFIGLEAAENLRLKGVEVTVIEMLSDFPPGYDPDMAALIRNHVVENGVRVMSPVRVLSIESGGSGRVRLVRTSEGDVEAGMVLMATGVRPNGALAQEAGLATSKAGAILVDEYMRTSDPDIFAAGDCAASTHAVSGEPAWFPMGSTANKMGRIAGGEAAGSLAHRQALRGVLGTSVFKVFELNCARTGLSTAEAVRLGHDVVTCTVPGPDRAHYYPGSRDIIIRLIADRASRRILGAQVLGEGIVDKPIDTLATTITLGGTVDDVATLDLAYAPPFSTAMSPVITSAGVALNKMNGSLEGTSAQDLQSRLGDPRLLLLDVRTDAEFTVSHIEGAVNIPVGELRERVGEVDRDRDIIVICRIGRRAYTAYLLLKELGFGSVQILDGGMLAYPYWTV